jgi:hypothetical protein
VRHGCEDEACFVLRDGGRQIAHSLAVDALGAFGCQWCIPLRFPRPMRAQ